MWIVIWWLFRSSFTHSNSGKSVEYSPFYGTCDIGKYDLIWFDLIWFDLIWFDWLDIPNLTENNIHYGKDSFEYTADLQATSTFPFHFHFHVLDADGLGDFIILHSNYNVVQKGMRSKENYFILPNQSIDDIPNDIQHLYLCGFSDYNCDRLTFPNNSFNHKFTDMLKTLMSNSNRFELIEWIVREG